MSEDSVVEAPVYPAIIDEVDRLKAGLLNAQLQNMQLQLQVMQSDIQKALQSRNELIKKMQDLVEVFRGKYGVDLTRLQLNEDGSYVELPATPRA